MNSRFVVLLLALGGIVSSPLRAVSAAANPEAPDEIPQLSIWNWPAYPPDALKEKVEGKVIVRAIVDPNGEVTSARTLVSVDPRLDKVAVDTVTGWKFTEGLQFGLPASYSMDVPIRFSLATVHKKIRPREPAPADLVPRPSPRTDAQEKSIPTAEYPEILAERKMQGVVTFALVISEEGRAVLTRITAATHVDFIPAALEALAHWEYIPAKQGDLPMKTSIENRIAFRALGRTREEILAGNGLTAPDGGVPPLPPEPYFVTDPVRPYDSVMAGKGETAAAEFMVMANGSVSAVKLREATSPEFGRALVAALETWGFNPAKENGLSVSVPLLLRVESKPVVAGQESATDPVERLVVALRAKQIGPAKDLDEILTPLFRPPPAYPAWLAENERTAGSAQIEFVIDREGRARVPRIVSASREEFGWSAATAVSQWVFKAPRRGGQPVDVLVRVPFEFGAPRK